MTKEEAARQMNDPKNLNETCPPCNKEKSSRELSDTPGDGKYVSQIWLPQIYPVISTNGSN
jgi:hypothetical protein